MNQSCDSVADKIESAALETMRPQSTTFLKTDPAGIAGEMTDFATNYCKLNANNDCNAQARNSTGRSRKGK